MGVKMNLRIITKNHAPDPEIGILTKSISKAYGRATAKPTAWELKEIEKRWIFRLFIIYVNYTSIPTSSYWNRHINPIFKIITKEILSENLNDR